MYSNMQEAWTICTRLWDAGLTLEHELSASGDRLYLKVGAEQHVLEHEAALFDTTGMPMRLKFTKGMCPYSAEYQDYYVPRLNDTCFDSGTRQRLVLNWIDRAIMLPLQARMDLMPPEKLMKELAVKLESERVVRALFLTELLTSVGGYRSHEELLREFGENTAKAAELSKEDKFFCVYPNDEEEDNGTPNAHEATGLEDLMATASKQIKSGKKQLTKVARASQGKKRKHVGKKEMDRRMREKLKERGLKPLTYTECREIHREIERWYARGGKDQKFIGTLQCYFPVHDDRELKFFMLKWANTELIYQLYILHKSNEGKYTSGAYYNEENKKKPNKQNWLEEKRTLVYE